MFFIMGVAQGEKEILYNNQIFCSDCGNYTNISVFVTYSVLSLFFIPTIKWGKRYYAKTNCCGSVYEINPEVGKMLEKGENVIIGQNELALVSHGKNNTRRFCRNCGRELEHQFSYCPYCGFKL